MNSKWIFGIACCLLIYGCYTPMEYLENGDYKMAYNKSMNKLIENKDVEETKLVLCKALDKMILINEQKALAYFQNEDLRKKEKAIAQYDKSISLINKSKKYTDGKYDVILDKIITQKDSTRQSLYQAYFERGMFNLNRFEKYKFKANAQLAYYDFVRAKYYSSESEHLDSLIMKSKNNGIVYVGYTVNPPTGAYLLSTDIQQTFGTLERYSGLFQTWTAYGESVPEHCDCKIYFDFGWPYEHEIIKTDQKQFKKKIQEFDQEFEVQTTVVTEYKEREIKLNLQMNVWGNSNCKLLPNTFSKYTKETAVKTTSLGDYRALPASYSDKNEMLSDKNKVIKMLMYQIFEDVCTYLG